MPEERGGQMGDKQIVQVMTLDPKVRCGQGKAGPDRALDHGQPQRRAGSVDNGGGRQNTGHASVYIPDMASTSNGPPFWPRVSSFLFIKNVVHHRADALFALWALRAWHASTPT